MGTHVDVSAIRPTVQVTPLCSSNRFYKECNYQLPTDPRGRGQTSCGKNSEESNQLRLFTEAVSPTTYCDSNLSNILQDLLHPLFLESGLVSLWSLTTIRTSRLRQTPIWPQQRAATPGLRLLIIYHHVRIEWCFIQDASERLTRVVRFIPEILNFSTTLQHARAWRWAIKNLHDIPFASIKKEYVSQVSQFYF